MIDFSLQSGTCHKFMDNLIKDKVKYDPGIIKNYPYFNYLLRSGTPNNFRYGKFGILLILFLGILKKLDASLIVYFDTIFYGLLKELDFTAEGLFIPRMELDGLRSFIHLLADVTKNDNLRVLRDHLNVSLYAEVSPEQEEILEELDMLLCHVIVRYNLEQLLCRLSIVSKINIFEINKILMVKYFPRTLLLLDDPECIPADFLISSPFRLYTYAKTLQSIHAEKDIRRIMALELKIFEIKFFRKKEIYDCCDRKLIREKINAPNGKIPVLVNDSVTILPGHYEKDIDLEYWTGSGPVKGSDKRVDVMIYYDYLNGKVRHQVLTKEIREIISFFKKGTYTKGDYLATRHDKLYSESKVNEMIYKNILM
jgi:hypothetical protein